MHNRSVVHRLITWTLALSSCFYITTSHAQDSVSYAVSVGTGIYFMALKNELISSSPATGSTAPIQILMEGRVRRYWYAAQFSYLTAKLTASSGFVTSQKAGHVQYLGQWRVSGKEKFSLFTGFTFITQGFRLENPAADAVANNNANYFFASIGPSASAELWRPKGSFAAKLWFTVLSYSRTRGYALAYPEESHWLGPKAFSNAGVRFSYNRILSRRFDARIDYLFDWFHFAEYEPITSISQQAIVSLSYKVYKK